MPLSPRMSTAEWVTATLRAIAIMLRTAALEPFIVSKAPRLVVERFRRVVKRRRARRVADELALALGPILELILQDQDSPLLLGDLVDLAAAAPD